MITAVVVTTWQEEHGPPHVVPVDQATVLFLMIALTRIQNTNSQACLIDKAADEADGEGTAALNAALQALGIFGPFS